MISIVLVMSVPFTMEVGTVNARVKVKRSPEASMAVHDRVFVSSMVFKPLSSMAMSEVVKLIGSVSVSVASTVCVPSLPYTMVYEMSSPPNTTAAGVVFCT